MGWLLIVLVLFAGAQAAADTLVAAGATWKYLVTGSDQGTAWHGTGFDDSSWPSGAAELGYGDGDETTVVGYGGDPDNKYITTYFRHTFNVTDTSAYNSVLLEVLRDDGAVVYLNGAEVFRTNMPGSSNYLTLASSPVGGGAESTFYGEALDTADLVDGDNVLAVEIHQIHASLSSDISFDLSLTGSTEVLDTLVARGSTWKYLDDGTDQGTAWQGTGFDDGGWVSGPAELGYGDGDEATVVSYGPNSGNKYRTTYFRHSFDVPDASIYGSMTVNVKRDDGVVVYLNDRELFRENLPGGTIIYTTNADSAIENNGFPNIDPYSMNVGDDLVSGTNVLAVEIHQAGGGSSDISFDLSLTASSEEIVTDIVRGPYLQNGTTDGVTIMWRTSTNESSKVWYGTSLGSLNQTVTDATLETDHTIRISGLPPASKYYYQVGMTDETVLAGGDADHYFVTSPTVGSTDPVRIWVLGDSGTANNNARAVRDAYLELAADENEADIWLMLGDNAYMSGTESEFQAAMFDMYPGILKNKVLWSTRGNHESSASVYYGIFDHPTQGEGGGFPSGTEHYYSFDYGNIHFICLNSQESTFYSNPSSVMYQWLEQDLADTTQEWIIAFWHHPPYSKGSHNSDTESQLIYMRQNALPILEAGGVDLVLTGHSHCYERSYFLNGHYGYSGSFDSNTHVVQAGDGREDGDGAYQKCGSDGTVYIVAGSSGQATYGTFDHAAMQVSFSRLGSLIIDVNDTRLDSRFLRNYTSPVQIDDYLTIEIGGCTFEDVANLVDRWLDTCNIGQWCEGWDINKDLSVDLGDLAIIGKYMFSTP